MPLPFSLFHRFKQIQGLLWRCLLMNDGAQRSHNGFRMGILPYISPKVYPYGSFLNPIVDEIKDLQLCLTLGSTCNNHRYRATGRYFFKILSTVIGFYDLCSEFSGNTAGKAQIPGRSFLKLLADR